MWLKVALISAICLLVNIPMGMMRERCRKFSLPWLLWIHGSIPLIVLLRVWLHLPPIAIPINIASALVGQFIGGAPEKKKRRGSPPAAP
jgi:uncharacterized membrane protein YdcZ (DUF606 family)